MWHGRRQGGGQLTQRMRRGAEKTSIDGVAAADYSGRLVSLRRAGAVALVTQRDARRA